MPGAYIIIAYHLNKDVVSSIFLFIYSFHVKPILMLYNGVEWWLAENRYTLCKFWSTDKYNSFEYVQTKVLYNSINIKCRCTYAYVLDII